MKLSPRRFVTILLFGVAAACATPAHAQYPDRAVRLVVGYAPGGSIDTLARIVARHLSDKWAKGVIVENRPGADSNLAAEAVAKSAPDGYTIFVSSNAFAMAAAQNAFPFDPAKSFAPIVLVASVPNVLVINASLASVRSPRDLIALAKSRPGALNFGTSGAGSPAFLQMTQLMQQTNTKMLEISYKGAGPALIALVTGEIQVMFASVTGAMPLIDARKLKALAVSTKVRSPLLPNVPAVAEALNIPFDEPGTWIGLLAPAATPEVVIGKFRKDVADTLQAPTIQRTLSERGFVTLDQGPEPFAAFIKSETAKSARLLQSMNR